MTIEACWSRPWGDALEKIEVLVELEEAMGETGKPKADVSHIPSCQTGEVQDTVAAWMAWCSPVV